MTAADLERALADAGRTIQRATLIAGTYHVTLREGGEGHGATLEQALERALVEATGEPLHCVECGRARGEQHAPGCFLGDD